MPILRPLDMFIIAVPLVLNFSKGLGYSLPKTSGRYISSERRIYRREAADISLASGAYIARPTAIQV